MTITYTQGLLIALILYSIIYLKYLKRTTPQYILKFTIMSIYLFLVICVTILPIDFTLDLKWHYNPSIKFTYLNLIPFIDLINHRPLALKEIILNIIMTIPFGILYKSLNKNTTLIKTIKATIYLSILIELTQLLMTCFLLHYRICDITDLITNTLGGLIGYLIYNTFIHINNHLNLHN